MPDEPRLFVGREQELAALKEAIARPEGQLILVVGGVGVGKSALLEELAVRVDQTDGWVAVPYQLNENDSSETFLPRLMADLLNVDGVTSGKFLWNAPGQIEKVKGFLSAVAKLPSLPGLGEAESLSGLIQLLLPDDKRPPREKFVVFLRYAASRLKEGQRLVLIFDPDKYLDKSQEPDWGSLARDIPEGVTLVFAQRPDDVLAESEALLTSPKTQRIPEEPLGHLPRDKSDELIAAGWRQDDAWKKLASEPPAELCQVLWDKYEGWPLPLTIVLRDLSQEPEGIDELVAAAQEMPRKLRDLLNLRYAKAAAEGDDAVRLLQGLAILERPATAGRVAALCGEGCTPAALTAAAHQPAVAKCVSVGGKGLLHLFHATMGECVLEQMSEEAKRDSHRRAAALYEKNLDQNGADKEALDRYPYHAYHAGEVKPFLEAVYRVIQEKCRLRLLRSSERDLRWALPLCRKLAEANPTAFLPDVAMTLNNLGGVLSDLGERNQARAAYEETVAIFSKLAPADPATFEPDLATALANLGRVLHHLGKWAQALQAHDGALIFCRGLAEADPTTFRPLLANTLNSAGAVLRDLGKRAKARENYNEALSIRRQLADGEPTAFLPDVAMTLNNLGGVLHDLGEPAQAREACEGALSIYRDLAEVEPGAYLPGLALTLNNLGDLLRGMGEPGEAQPILEEGLAIYRKLAAAEPAAFGLDLARVLSNLGNVLGALGERSEARAACEEAVAVLRKLAEVDPAAFEPHLATALNNSGGLLHDLGERLDARSAYEESREIRRRLARADPAAFEPYLGGTLSNLGLLLAELEKWDEARPALEEALGILAPWVRQEPKAFAARYALAVGNALRLLEQTGDNPEEWPALVEAIKLLAQLHAAEHEDAQNES